MGARTNRADDFLGLGRRENELQMRRRLFDELEQRIESGRRHHVRFVDDVDLETRLDRCVERAFTQIAGVVDTAVRGRVDLDHVNASRAGRRKRDARLAHATRGRRRTLLAVQRPRQDPRRGRLPAAARPGEQVGVVHPVIAQRLLERLSHVLLADDLGERARPVFAVERETHAPPSVADEPKHLRPRTAIEDRGPPAHPPGPAYPCCLPALGGFVGWTPREGSAPECNGGRRHRVYLRGCTCRRAPAASPMGRLVELSAG